MNRVIIGLDIAKSIFHLVFQTASGKMLKKKKLKRHQVLAYFANIAHAIVVVEAGVILLLGLA